MGYLSYPLFLYKCLDLDYSFCSVTELTASPCPKLKSIEMSDSDFDFSAIVEHAKDIVIVTKAHPKRSWPRDCLCKKHSLKNGI